ncbi:uncharacterized protein BX663DRAFT_522173 [Cokeromyces recurvatus]|uniref:uncharacterized protein n=1 Tax=Cokeromyces recurvatus TaxID=90255 RepID=UPI0022206286|nr:uncharacterized protein BX663DRAFT_522173 [Cokeromyces recurvatus]KAI7899315.1 hypothetical protein BX663DRAFT_522173 [Cokeromyces recurvatus]
MISVLIGKPKDMATIKEDTHLRKNMFSLLLYFYYYFYYFKMTIFDSVLTSDIVLLDCEVKNTPILKYENNNFKCIFKIIKDKQFYNVTTTSPGMSLYVIQNLQEASNIHLFGPETVTTWVNTNGFANKSHKISCYEIQHQDMHLTMKDNPSRNVIITLYMYLYTHFSDTTRIQTRSSLEDIEKNNAHVI